MKRATNNPVRVFEEWLERTDKYMDSHFGVTTDDVEDHDWWDLWDAGLTPVQAVEDFMEDHGWTWQD